MAKTTVRALMPPSRRAKQFAPFDALKGLKEAIARKEHVPEPRRELSEEAIAEINAKLTMLKPGSCVTVVYYCDYNKTAYRLLKENQIAHFKIGRSYRIPKLNILNYISVNS